MIRGTDMHGVLAKSLVLAISSTLCTLPYFHYLIFEISLKQRLSESFNPLNLLLTQLLILFILTLLSAMIGFSFANRYELPVLGDPRGLMASLPLVSGGGALMIIFSYFLFDRYFLKISPVSYPMDPIFLLSYPFKRAFTDEVILRFCLVTIAVGLLKSKTAGIILVSVFASIVSIKYFLFMGIAVRLNYIFITQFLLGFSANLFLGYLFVTRGLLYSMCLGFLFGMKYLIISLLL